MSIGVESLASEIAKGLAEYNQAVTDGIKEVVEKVSTQAVTSLKNESPKRKGTYAKDWTSIKAYEDRMSKRKTVYNKSNYQLTHLLEKGHALRNGGRSKTIEHIKPIEEAMINEFENEAKRVIG